MFSFVFLLVGLPMLFSLEVLLDVGNIFTYTVIAIVLILNINFKKIFKFKINNNIYMLFLLFLSINFGVLSLFSKGLTFKHFISLGTIIILIITALTLDKREVEKFNLILNIFIISLISVILIYISTPLSHYYWTLYGGRLYIGDTNNPHIVAWTSMLNVLAAVYLMLNNIKNFLRFIIIIFVIMDLYLFFMSVSRSTLLGLLFILIYIILKNKHKIFKILTPKRLFKFILFCLLLGSVFYDEIRSYIKIVHLAAISLIQESQHDLSASIRRENLEYAFELMDFFNFWGYGVGFFRMDNPILQAFIDLGNFIGMFFLIFMFFIPIYKIFLSKLYINNKNEEFAVIIYLFFLPNLFFHGTPYEWIIWLPVIIFYLYIKK